MDPLQSPEASQVGRLIVGELVVQVRPTSEFGGTTAWSVPLALMSTLSSGVGEGQTPAGFGQGDGEGVGGGQIIPFLGQGVGEGEGVGEGWGTVKTWELLVPLGLMT